MSMLHAHTEGDIFHRIYEEVIIHGLLDTLNIIPFLFVTYLLVELFEHKGSSRLRALSRRAGKLGPLAGGLLGAVPQCGLSAAASDLYTRRVISLGTLIAIFVSTSDEMLPIMISGKASVGYILAILGYKAAVGIAVGFLIDLVLRKRSRQEDEPTVDEENCECEHCCKHGI